MQRASSAIGAEARRQTPYGKTSYSTVQCPHSTNLEIRRKIIDRYAQACGRKNVFLSLHGIVDGSLDGSSSCRRGDFVFFGPFLGRDRGRESWGVGWAGGGEVWRLATTFLILANKRRERESGQRTLLGYVWLCFM